MLAIAQQLHWPKGECNQPWMIDYLRVTTMVLLTRLPELARVHTSPQNDNSSPAPGTILSIKGSSMYNEN